MPDLLTPTIEDEIIELKRELAFRERVFADWVQRGKMKQQVADWRTACMQATLRRLENAR